MNVASNEGYSALVNLIVHSNQSQPIGRSGRTRFCAIAAIEWGGHACRHSLSGTHFNQRSDNGSDHVSEEALGRYNYRNLILRFLDIHAFKGSHMGLSLTNCYA